MSDNIQTNFCNALVETYKCPIWCHWCPRFEFLVTQGF